MSSTTDIEMMQRLCEGSDTALRDIIDRHRERLFQLAYRLLNDRDDACDAVQETFIRLWKNARRYNPSQSLTTWLCTICTRRCYDELRRRRRHRNTLALINVDTIHPDDMSANELIDLLHLAVADLPPKQRVVYQLREIEDLDTDAVAAATHMSTDQVKANLCVARQKVREKLKHYGI